MEGEKSLLLAESLYGALTLSGEGRTALPDTRFPFFL